jgi:hypothetical protein
MRYAFAKSGADAAFNGPVLLARGELRFRTRVFVSRYRKRNERLARALQSLRFTCCPLHFFGGSGAFGYRGVGDR